MVSIDILTKILFHERRNASDPEANSNANTNTNSTTDNIADYRKNTMTSIINGNGMTITLQNVSYAISVVDKDQSTFFRKKKMNKTLLDDVSCSFVPGRLCALMGSSGAGKSTLMDLLAGRKTQGTIEGSLLFDGKERPNYFKRIAGYVEQNDVLIPTLTVFETLTYAAELRLSKCQYTREEKSQRVIELLNELGLSHCKDSFVGNNLIRGVSGGERKRVSIGVELITYPRVLFLDEPTSGLDSSTTLDVVRILRQLSRNGRTIICTIHQPSACAFQLFDQLILLSKGRICYNGPSYNSEAFFRSIGFTPIDTVGNNPADFILSVVNKRDDNVNGNWELNLADEWNKTTLHERRLKSTTTRITNTAQNVIALEDLPHVNSQWHELRTLMSRTMKCNLRDRNYIGIHFIKNVFIGLLLVSIFYNVNDTDTYPNINSLALLFMVVTLWSMNGIAYIAPLIQDREVYYRERQVAAYRVLPYYFHRCIIELPFSILTVSIFSCIVYWGCDYPSEANKFFIFWTVVFLCNECAQAFAYAVSAASPTFEVATAVTPMILIIFMLFSGFMLTTSEIPDYWRYTVRYISFMAYAFQALGNYIFAGTPNDVIIPLYQLDEYSTGTNIGCLVAMIAMWRILGILAIKYITYQTR